MVRHGNRMSGDVREVIGGEDRVRRTVRGTRPLIEQDDVTEPGREVQVMQDCDHGGAVVAVIMDSVRRGDSYHCGVIGVVSRTGSIHDCHGDQK